MKSTERTFRLNTQQDLTLVTLGPTLYTAIAAADELKSKHGLEAEIIDLGPRIL